MEQNMKQNIPGQNGNTKQQLAAQTRKLRGISGSTLKLIAVITMIIDHVAAGILIRYLFRNGIHDLDINNMSAVNQWMDQNAALFSTYNAMRLIGRIAFPIYCFLLVQGFEYTHNRLKYAARLLMFAAISEIPFDLLFKGQILEFGYQNVFFTLFFGLAVMMGLRWVEENLGGRMFTPLLYLIVIAAGMAAAQLAKTDYAAIGILCIVVTYLFRKKKIWQIVSGCIVFSWELTAPLAYIPIAFYNGKRGWKLKYFFYLVYPVHLFVLYLICMGLGIDSYPAM